MKLIFSPIRKDERLQVSVKGDILILNGEEIDFGSVPAGETLSLTSEWIAGDVNRTAEGELCVTLLLPHGYKAPMETLFPSPLQVTSDGPVDIPAYEVVEEEILDTLPNTSW